MKIVVSAGEILEAGTWDDFCDAKGINPWCINEGLMPRDEEFRLSEDEARRFNVLPRRED